MNKKCNYSAKINNGEVKKGLTWFFCKK